MQDEERAAIEKAWAAQANLNTIEHQAARIAQLEADRAALVEGLFNLARTTGALIVAADGMKSLRQERMNALMELECSTALLANLSEKPTQISDNPPDMTDR